MGAPMLRQAVTSAARLALGQLRDRLGAAGVAAMRALPVLLAEVDQHAAQVQEALADSGVSCIRSRWPPTPTGWPTRPGSAVGRPTRSTTGWHHASWTSVRLLAVCVLAGAATV